MTKWMNLHLSWHRVYNLGCREQRWWVVLPLLFAAFGGGGTHSVKRTAESAQETEKEVDPTQTESAKLEIFFCSRHECRRAQKNHVAPCAAMYMPAAYSALQCPSSRETVAFHRMTDKRNGIGAPLLT